MPDEPGTGNDSGVYEFTLGEFDADERIDQVLAAYCPDLSRTHIQKLIRDGKLTVNGKVCDVPRLKFPAGAVARLTESLPSVPDRAGGGQLARDRGERRARARTRARRRGFRRHAARHRAPA